MYIPFYHPEKFIVDHGETSECLVQDCSNSSVLAVVLLQSCAKPSIWYQLTQDNLRGCEKHHELLAIYKAMITYFISWGC